MMVPSILSLQPFPRTTACHTYKSLLFTGSELALCPEPSLGGQDPARGVPVLPPGWGAWAEGVLGGRQRGKEGR